MVQKEPGIRNDLMSRAARILVVLSPVVAGALAMLFVPAIPQDQAYHRFADDRPWMGISNFADVASNLPFVLVGVFGLALLRRFRLLDPRERWMWGVFFASHLLAGLGSAWYHARPDDARLLWDRLPLTGVIMSLAAIVTTERIGLRAGIASMILWRAAGDLRLYALVQFAPMLCLPIAILLFPPRYTRGSGYGWAIALYAAAKACELLDRPIFEALGAVSGHTIKHILAGAAGAAILIMVAKRREVCDAHSPVRIDRSPAPHAGDPQVNA
jgi:hypothetical protein